MRVAPFTAGRGHDRDEPGSAEVQQRGVLGPRLSSADEQFTDPFEALQVSEAHLLVSFRLPDAEQHAAAIWVQGVDHDAEPISGLILRLVDTCVAHVRWAVGARYAPTAPNSESHWGRSSSR